MEPQAVQSSFLLKRVRAFYAWFVILVFILVGSFIVYYKLAAAPAEEETTTPPEGTEKPLVKVGIPVEVSALFPKNPPEISIVAFNSNIYEGLTIIRNGKVVGGLATSWSNPDKNTWRFKLRNGVTYQNGNEFNAEDVKYSIEQAQIKGWASYNYLPPIEKITVIDPLTVEIRTKDPDPVLLSKLAYAFIFSKKQAESEGFDKLVGTGPYKLAKFEKNTYTLEAHSSYWGGKPKVKQVVYKYILPDKMSDALMNGEIDIAVLADPKNNEKLRKEGFTVKSFNSPEIFILIFDLGRDKTSYSNATKNPFKDKRVRQALLYGIDINELIKNSPYSENGVAADQLVTSDIFGYNPNIKRPAYDLEKAKKLLAEAGYPSGFDLTVDIPIAFGIDEELVRQLKRIGIEAKANVLTKDEDFARVLSGDFSLLAFAWATETLDTGEIFDSALHTKIGVKGANNIQGYSNPELDKIADEASTTFIPKQRLELLKKASKLAMEELPWLPLCYLKSYGVVRKDFDWTPHTFGMIYAYEIVGK